MRRQIWLEMAIVTTTSVLVIIAVGPTGAVSNSLPLGTDLTGHVVVPWAGARDLTSFLPGGWSTAMLAGFPINQLYPGLPNLAAALLSLVLPLAVAFKLVVLAPIVLLPPAAYAAGRLARLPSPAPALMAVLTTPFLFNTACPACGGDVASTVNGEYAYAWSLLLGLLALGVLDRLLRTGRGPIVTATALTAAAVSHPVPTLWLALGVVVVVLSHRPWRSRQHLVTVARVLGAAVLLSCIWWLPFAWRREWMPTAGLPNSATVLDSLLPMATPLRFVFVAALVLGVIAVLLEPLPLTNALLVTTAAAAAAFVLIPAGSQLTNTRLVPFWYLGSWLVIGVGLAWAARMLSAAWERRRVSPDGTSSPGRYGGLALPVLFPAFALIACLAIVGTTWGWWAVQTPPRGAAAGTTALVGTSITPQGAAVRAVLEGSEARGDAVELESVRQLLREVGQRGGCGRLSWDQGDPRVGAPFGDPQILWQAGIWTDGCITPISGVLLDSSATTPAVLMTQSLVSASNESLFPSVPLFQLDLTAGIPRMQTLGVRYYLTHGGEPAKAAVADRRLQLLANAGPWQVWRIPVPAAVASLRALPSVVTPAIDDGSWDNLATAYFGATTFDTVPLVQSGPASWPRVALSVLPGEAPIDPAVVTDIREASDSISFSVQKTGQPVLVRVSAFPGWVVDGADGPYRSTPNFMVVVPSQNRVTLTHARTPVDYAALAAFAAGAAVLLVPVIRRPRRSGRASGGELAPTDLAGSRVG